MVDAHGATVLPGFNDSHIHLLSGGLAFSELDLSGTTTLEAVKAAIARLRDRARRSTVDRRPRLDLRLVRRPADATTARRADARSAGIPDRVRRPHGLGEQPRPEAGGHHAENAQSGERHDREGSAHRRADRRAAGKRDGPDGRRAAAADARRRSCAPCAAPSRTRTGSASPACRTQADRRTSSISTGRCATAESWTSGSTTRCRRTRRSAKPTSIASTPFGRSIPTIRCSRPARSSSSSTASSNRTRRRCSRRMPTSRRAGHPNYTPAQLNRIVTMLDRRGWQVLIHAIGDRGVRMALDAFEVAQAANPPPARGRRHRIEHIETIDPADMPRFAKLGVIASMQPLHSNPAPDLMSLWTKNLGPERSSRGWLYGSLLKSGARLAFGSDWPVVTLDPRLGLHVATTRTSPEGLPDGGWLPEERLTLKQALDAYSAGAAFASFDEQRKGTLAARHAGRHRDSYLRYLRARREAPGRARRASRFSTAASCTTASRTPRPDDRPAELSCVTSLSHASGRPRARPACGVRCSR